MNTEKDTESKILTVNDMGSIFIHKLWAIALVAVLAVVSSFTFITVTYTPKYSSTAIMYIVRENMGDASSGELSSDFSLALKVVNDCDYLLKSDSVLEVVKSDLHLDGDCDDLAKNIKTNNPSNTRVLEVTVEADTPELAKSIADKLCEFGAQKINEAMGFDQVNLYQRGSYDPEPSNKTPLLTYVFIGFIAVIATYLIFLIRFIVDDTIRTDEDVQRYLGLSVLGELPDADETHKKKYGYYRRGYGRGKYYRSSYGHYGRTHYYGTSKAERGDNE